MHLPVIARDKVAVLDGELVWVVLEETMTSTIRMQEKVTTVGWMGLCIQTELTKATRARCLKRTDGGSAFLALKHSMWLVTKVLRITSHHIRVGRAHIRLQVQGQVSLQVVYFHQIPVVADHLVPVLRQVCIIMLVVGIPRIQAYHLYHLALEVAQCSLTAA
jgi:hypothetical protein